MITLNPVNGFYEVDYDKFERTEKHPLNDDEFKKLLRIGDAEVKKTIHSHFAASSVYSSTSSSCSPSNTNSRRSSFAIELRDEQLVDDGNKTVFNFSSNENEEKQGIHRDDVGQQQNETSSRIATGRNIIVISEIIWILFLLEN